MKFATKIECIDSANNWLDEFTKKIDQAEAPDTIYHHTNDVGLFGILSTKTFHLSNLFNLNDPSELNYGLGALKKQLQQYPDVWNLVGEFIKSPDDLAHFFSLSFSTNHDDLNQWRAYGANGMGFAIGFNRQLLEKSLCYRDKSGCASLSLNYEEDDLNKSQKIMAEYFIEMKEFSNKASDFAKLIGHAYQIAAAYKHKAYLHEKEYRFLKVVSKDSTEYAQIKTKVSRGELVKYIEYDWSSSSSALETIIIGPAADETKARDFIRKCLEIGKLTLPDEKIVVSDIPYRT